MRKWIDIISESMTSNMVFHSTEWGVEILNDGMIRANSMVNLGSFASKANDLRYDEAQHETKGVCVTRSFYFARQFSEVIFGLDVDRIRHNFQMKPRAEAGAYDLADDHGDFRVEAEEFIVCNGLALARYCTAIWVSEDRGHDLEYAALVRDPRFRGFFQTP